jgi:hypothetical protein
MTLSKLLSKLISNLLLFTTFCRLLCLIKSFGKSTIRGFGDHHNIGSSSEYQGKIPQRYASIKRSGRKSPPIANKPSEFACEGCGKLIELFNP